MIANGSENVLWCGRVIFAVVALFHLGADLYGPAEHLSRPQRGAVFRSTWYGSMSRISSRFTDAGSCWCDQTNTSRGAARLVMIVSRRRLSSRGRSALRINSVRAAS